MQHGMNTVTALTFNKTMTIKDFIGKKVEQTKNRGLYAATMSSVAEIVGRSRAKYGDAGTPIWEHDWDICIVFDSLRYDTMVSRLSAEETHSIGSATVEWTARTFSDDYREHWEDAGYVTSNPFSGREGGTRWTDEPAYPLRNRGLAYLDEVWVDEWGAGDIETVDPVNITRRALWAWANRDELGIDRLVVHYLQPHAPFRSKPEWFSGWGGADKFGRVNKQEEYDVWQLLGDGDIGRSEFMDAYDDNLGWALAELAMWRGETDANVMVTSDHGNGAGEYGLYGHPPGIHIEPLMKVPKYTFEGDGDEPDVDITADLPVNSGDEKLEERLAALGYK